MRHFTSLFILLIGAITSILVETNTNMLLALGIVYVMYEEEKINANN